MHLQDIKVSRHETPDLVKIEFNGEEDAVLVSMRGDGVNDLSDEQAIGRALRVMSGVLGDDTVAPPAEGEMAGTDQTSGQP